MTVKVTVPNTFATATTSIPLSQLDTNFGNLGSAINNAATYSNYAVDVGVVNNYAIDITGIDTTYVAGIRFQFKAANTNTNACSLNVNSQGTKAIVRTNGTDLPPGSIITGAIVDVMYDGTNFQLMNSEIGGITTQSITTGANIFPNSDTATQYEITALASAALFEIPVGTPTDGQKLIIRIKDNGSARLLSWTTSAGGYRAVGVTLPTATIPSKVTYVGCIYNGQDSYWDVVSVAQEV